MGRESWSWLRPNYPPVAFDLDLKALAMVRVGRRKRERFVASFEVEEVPPDLIEMDFMRWRIATPEKFRSLVSGLAARDPLKLNRASVVIPDSYARVSLLPFEEVPRSRHDALELVRWKTKKTVPFKVEEASADYQVIHGTAGPMALAVLTPKSIIEEIEQVFESLGVHAGLVELSTLSLVNLYRGVFEREGANAAEIMLANVTGTYFSFVILRNGELAFFRSKPVAVDLGEGGEEGSLKLLRRELQTSLVYYREKLGGKGLAKVYLRVVDHNHGAVIAIFEREAEAGSVTLIDPRRVLSANGRFSGERGDLILQRLAPALGAACGRSAP